MGKASLCPSSADDDSLKPVTDDVARLGREGGKNMLVSCISCESLAGLLSTSEAPSS